MNKSLHLLVAVAGVLFALAAGCAPASAPVSYHSLVAADPAPHVSAPQESRMALVVGPVSIPDLLKNSQIATGGTGGRYRLSEQHRWAGEVDREFARAIAEQLVRGLDTEQVSLYPAGQYLQPKLQIVLDVVAMEGELGKEAKLDVRWSLVDPKSKTALLTRRTTLAEQPADSGYDAWIEAQRRNIAKLGKEIAAAIRASR
ncbi:PqiC family protein [Desulfobulbus sp.]|uniref:PqiC family protein n=1 Tax=Desulfobulbus sp. TaxID=895 RepID=UPI00286F80B0|nr:PqiC family protein [Desulfobulbus sp.]